MPELPDVEVFRRLAVRHCHGRVVKRVAVHDRGSVAGATAATLQRRISGQRITACRRHGKHLFLEAGKAGVLELHFGPNGSLRFVPGDEDEPDYTRVALELDDGAALAYVNPRRIGRVRLIDSEAGFLAAQDIGPDLLAASFTATAFAAALDDSRQPIKSALMDQSRMAGVGNTYADEILFQARLHPATPTVALEAASRRALFSIIRKVLRKAIACDPSAEGYLKRLPKTYLLPHRHPGGHCARCGTRLVMPKIGGRTSFHCPHCQPPPRKGRAA